MCKLVKKLRGFLLEKPGYCQDFRSSKCLVKSNLSQWIINNLQ